MMSKRLTWSNSWDIPKWFVLSIGGMAALLILATVWNWPHVGELMIAGIIAISVSEFHHLRNKHEKKKREKIALDALASFYYLFKRTLDKLNSSEDKDDNGHGQSLHNYSMKQCSNLQIAAYQMEKHALAFTNDLPPGLVRITLYLLNGVSTLETLLIDKNIDKYEETLQSISERDKEFDKLFNDGKSNPTDNFEDALAALGESWTPENVMKYLFDGTLPKSNKVKEDNVQKDIK